MTLGYGNGAYAQLSSSFIASCPGRATVCGSKGWLRTGGGNLHNPKELTVKGTIGSPGVWPQTLAFVARTGLDLSPMVTATFDLAAATDAYDAARQTDRNVKVHIRHGASR